MWLIVHIGWGTDLSNTFWSVCQRFQPCCVVFCSEPTTWDTLTPWRASPLEVRGSLPTRGATCKDLSVASEDKEAWRFAWSQVSVWIFWSSKIGSIRTNLHLGWLWCVDDPSRRNLLQQNAEIGCRTPTCPFSLLIHPFVFVLSTSQFLSS